MAEREVEVMVQIGGIDVTAGRMWAHRRGKTESATFSYSPEYLARDDAYPLDPMLPLAAGQLQTPVGRSSLGSRATCGTWSAGRRWR